MDIRHPFYTSAANTHDTATIAPTNTLSTTGTVPALVASASFVTPGKGCTPNVSDGNWSSASVAEMVVRVGRVEDGRNVVVCEGEVVDEGVPDRAAQISSTSGGRKRVSRGENSFEGDTDSYAL